MWLIQKMGIERDISDIVIIKPLRFRFNGGRLSTAREFKAVLSRRSNGMIL